MKRTSHPDPSIRERSSSLSVSADRQPFRPFTFEPRKRSLNA